MSAREIYRRTKKVPDLVWNTYVCRPPAAVVVSWLQGSRITPNQITLASLVVAAIAAVLLIVLDGHVGLVVAIFVYELSYVLDCADGMLARWRSTASPAGHLLDFLMDEIKAFLVLGAAAIRLWLESRQDSYLLAGIFGLVALASGVAMTTFERRPEVLEELAPGDVEPSGPEPLAQLPASAPRAKPLWARVPMGFAKFLIHYPSYIWIAALAGRLELYFWPYLAVHTLYAARCLVVVILRFCR